MTAMGDVQLAVQFVESGRYADALRELSAVAKREGDLGLDVRVLLTEVLEECGRYADAEKAANAVLENSRADEKAKSRVLIALARIRHAQRAFAESSRLFSEARALAQTSDDSRLACLAQLAALGTVADAWPRSVLSTYVSELRQRLLRLGDRKLIARLHNYLARFEVFSGNLSMARRHLEAGRRLVEQEHDLLLEARFANTEAGICWFTSEYERGLELSSRAIRHFEVSGAAWQTLASKASRCWFRLHLGQFEEAEQELRELLSQDPPLLGRLIILDTYVDLALAVGHTEEAERLINRTSSVLCNCPSDGPSYYELNCQESKIRLLGQKGDWKGAETVAEAAIQSSLARSERLASARFRLFLVEAHLRQRNLAEAVAEGVLAGSQSESLTGGHRAQLERVLGLLFEACGQPAIADRHLARAVRINSTSGNAWANLEAARDHERVARQVSISQPADPADLVACILELAPHPELLAYECADLLQTMDCGSTIQVLSIGQDGEAKLLLSSESGSGSGCGQPVANEDPVAIPTGERCGDRFEVLVRPKDNLGSRLAIVNVKKIVSSALALERLRQAERERESLWPKDEPPDQEVGVFTSAEMTNLLATARRVAPTEIPILLTGETGTGKEVLGRAIHGASNRATKPFLAFNCAAVPRDMLESQLFGYRRGAFTGAQDAFPGVIRGAAGGTVFLDEVGEIPPETQPKLLRFLETKEIHPLGETEPISVDVRVVAATNADLDRLVGERRFREDLLYRLNVVRFHLPPLRQRREEIPQLVNHFLLRYADELQRGRPQISEEAMEYLLLYGWPGNVRQLANEIHRAVVLVEPNGCITPDTLSVDVRASRRTIPTGARPSADEMLVRTDQPLAKAIERVERVMVARALERASGRFEAAAKLLGVTRKGLFLKRQRLGLKSPPA